MPRLLHRHPLACAATLALVACGLVLAGAAAAQAQQAPAAVDWSGVGYAVGAAFLSILGTAGAGAAGVGAGRRLAPPPPPPPAEVVARLPDEQSQQIGQLVAIGRRNDREIRRLRKGQHEHARWLTAIAIKLDIDDVPRPPALVDPDDDSDSDNPDT